jgi:thioredoxin 1
MKAVWNIVVVVLLVGAVVAVFALKRADESRRAPVSGGETPALVATGAAEKTEPVEAAPPAQALPRLVDLGSDTCIPCKMMVPVLEALKKEYAGRLSVEFYDVREDPGAGPKYGIRVIPTQIFLDATGKELFRHEGFFSKEDILAKWNELGVKLGDTK